MKKYILLLLLLISFACYQDKSADTITAHDALKSEENSSFVDKAVENSDISDTKVHERKQIKQGTVRFQTNDLEKTRTHILAAVKQTNAYIEMDEANERGENYQNYLVIRVPMQSFDALLEQILVGVKRVDCELPLN